MKTIMGVVVPTAGEVRFAGRSLAGVSVAERVRRGIAPVLEARRLFPRMTVYENLEMGAYTRQRGPEFAQDLERVFALFPRVKERLKQLAGTLSGGEQQMVAIGRALMAHPRLLCMDEPSMGLAPVFVEQVFDIIQTINRQGTTIFMVEQNANMALQIADRAYVLQTGQVVLVGRGGRIAPEPDDPRSLSGRNEGRITAGEEGARAVEKAVPGHAGQHRRDKDPALPPPEHERSQCRTRAISDQPPPDPEQDGADDERPIEAGAARAMKLGGENGGRTRPRHAKPDCGNRDRARHHKGKARVPAPGDIEKSQHLCRIDHVRDNEAEPE